MVSHGFVVYMSIVVNMSGRVWGRVRLVGKTGCAFHAEAGRTVVRVGGCN